MTSGQSCMPCRRSAHDRCTNGACACEACHQPLVVWEEPPARSRGPQGTLLDDEVAAELRSHPKRWARVKTFPKKTSANSVATRIRKGDCYGGQLVAGEWEATARQEGTGSVLYLRFVGGR